MLLVGNDVQLKSADAGGAFGLLFHDRGDASELVDVHGFTYALETTAFLDLRHGRTNTIDAYDAHGSIHEGETEQMLDTVYTAWRADLLAGIGDFWPGEAGSAIATSGPLLMPATTDPSLSSTGAQWGGTAIVPADYVAEHG